MFSYGYYYSEIWNNTSQELFLYLCYSWKFSVTKISTALLCNNIKKLCFFILILTLWCKLTLLNLSWRTYLQRWDNTSDISYFPPPLLFLEVNISNSIKYVKFVCRDICCWSLKWIQDYHSKVFLNTFLWFPRFSEKFKHTEGETNGFFLYSFLLSLSNI